MSATISVRKLGPNNDPLQGQGQGNFLTDINAVAQIIQTTLDLLAGEWWEALGQGTPLFWSAGASGILGGSGSASAQKAASSILKDRILSVPYVLSITAATVSFNAATRSASFQFVVTTQFGTLSVSYTPGKSAAIAA